ncbi:hypothetical protein D3C79_505120 [compost metagenome]
MLPSTDDDWFQKNEELVPYAVSNIVLPTAVMKIRAAITPLVITEGLPNAWRNVFPLESRVQRQLAAVVPV